MISKSELFEFLEMGCKLRKAFKENKYEIGEEIDLSKIELNEKEIEELNERRKKIMKLRKKYGKIEISDKE